VNYCGNCVSENGTTYSNPFDWLDDFFTDCQGCRVDYIALHWYGGGNSMMGYINDARKYGKPIWVTEFADWDAGVTAQVQKSYLAGTVNFLERDPGIYRYSWFIGRGNGASVFPYNDLYGPDGVMTSLGQLYLDMPVYDSLQKFEIPGKIEAEEYYLQNGLFSELSNDIDGFMDIGYTDAGDWIKYKINVMEAGDYTITTRYAGTAAGKFDVYIDEIKKATINTMNSGGWQNWQSLNNSVSLPAGTHMLKIVAVTAGFNLNWFKFTKGAEGVEESTSNTTVTISPNPVTDNHFKIFLDQSVNHSISIRLADASGKTIYSKIENPNGNSLGINLNESPGKGVYFLTVQSNEISCTTKIIFLK
jgi:hypothetical protein